MREERRTASEAAGVTALLPWLRLDAPLTFGRVTVAQTSQLPARSLDLCAELRRSLSPYRCLDGSPVDAAVMWFTAKDLVAVLSEEEVENLRAHSRVLAIASIASNHYFEQASSPVTTAHFDTYLHSLSPGQEHVTVVSRRRDGENLASWDMENVRFTVPASAAVGAVARPSHEFLEALATTLDQQDDVVDRIVRSTPAFLSGNRLEDFNDLQQDLIWLGSALEQLLDIAGRGIGHQIGERIVEFLKTGPRSETQWADPRGKLRTGDWLARWAEEFYDHRSAIHGAPARSRTWLPWEHGLVATVVWILLVKKLLADRGLYTLTRDDLIEFEALGRRVASGSPLGERWGDARHRASWQVTTRQAAAHLDELLASDDTTEAP